MPCWQGPTTDARDYGVSERAHACGRLLSENRRSRKCHRNGAWGIPLLHRRRILARLVSGSTSGAVSGTRIMQVRHCKNPSLVKEPSEERYIMGYSVADGLPPNLGFGMTTAASPTFQYLSRKPRKAALALIFGTWACYTIAHSVSRAREGSGSE